MTSINFDTDNISFITIPVAWVLAMAPRVYARYAYRSSSGKDIDLGNPREFSKTVSNDSGCDAKTRGRIGVVLAVRAEAAMNNGFENIGLYAAAIVAGNTANLPIKVLNLISISYLVSRVFYNIVYVHDLPKSRVVAYFGGLGCVMTLFLKAGEAYGG